MSVAADEYAGLAMAARMGPDGTGWDRMGPPPPPGWDRVGSYGIGWERGVGTWGARPKACDWIFNRNSPYKPIRPPPDDDYDDDYLFVHQMSFSSSVLR